MRKPKPRDIITLRQDRPILNEIPPVFRGVIESVGQDSYVIRFCWSIKDGRWEPFDYGTRIIDKRVFDTICRVVETPGAPEQPWAAVDFLLYDALGYVPRERSAECNTDTQSADTGAQSTS